MLPDGHGSAADIVLFSTADWDNPFWTNKQHVAVELVRRGYRVLYIDSVGLRAPSASASDLQRIVRRLWKAVRFVRRVRVGGPGRRAGRLWVLSPLVVPLQRFQAVRVLNRLLLSVAVGAARRFLALCDPFLWTYNPLTVAFLDLRRFAGTIYHCVDEIAAQPGMPAAEIERQERRLCRRSAIVFVTSPVLLESRRLWNPATHFYPNVADTAHFAQACALRDAGGAAPTDLAPISRPRLIFVGAVSSYKVDVELVRAVAELRPDWQVLIIGKVGEGEPLTDVSALYGCSNIHLMGARSYSELPEYLGAADVALLPARINRYTRAMFPMKYFEYLAAGLPVVATDLPALAEFRAYHYVGVDAPSFVAAVAAALADSAAGQGSTPRGRVGERLAFAAEFTYERRTARMVDDIRAIFGSDRW